MSEVGEGCEQQVTAKCVLAVSFPLPHTYDYLLSSTRLPLP